MKFTFVIPVYISRSSKEGWKEGDAVYDHPTPFDEKGTLVRTLESLKSIQHEKFEVILVVAAVAPSLEKEALNFVKERLAEATYRPQSIYTFSHGTFKKIAEDFSPADRKKFKSLFSLDGYSEVRNAGFVAAALRKADVVIWLDDDELVNDKNFIKKIREGFAKRIGKEKIRLLTGACPEGETGSYLRVRPMRPWMEFWNKIYYQNEAFKKIIGMAPRWKVSPFAHGGLSAIHREVFDEIPCDPYVRRGEDMDFNMNARMFGYTFFLDNTLEIRHCPPPRTHPQWRRVREDIIRYLRQRNKIRNQKRSKGMRKITAEEFDPYPGPFLKDNLEDLIRKSQTMLSEEYLAEGKKEDAREALKNIEVARSWSRGRTNAFAEYMRVQKLWVGFTKSLRKLSGSYCEKV